MNYIGVKEVMDLESVSRVDGWCRTVFAKLTQTGGANLSYRKWFKTVSRYYIDYFNTKPNDEQTLNELHYELIQYTSIKLKLPFDSVEEAFTLAENVKPKLLTYGDLVEGIPNTLQRELLKIAGPEAFTQLCTRYYILTRTESLFLSMAPDIYDRLRKSRRLPWLEAYASPFNHSTDTYCSLFDEDQVYGALPRFDVFIDALNFPACLFVNPPYTHRVMDVCINKIVDYMKRCRGEFIVLLPATNCFSVNNLLEVPNTAFVILEEGTYYMHNYLSGGDIVPMVQLYLITNVGGCKRQSQSMANNIAFRLRNEAQYL